MSQKKDNKQPCGQEQKKGSKPQSGDQNGKSGSDHDNSKFSGT